MSQNWFFLVKQISLFITIFYFLFELTVCVYVKVSSKYLKDCTKKKSFLKMERLKLFVNLLYHWHLENHFKDWALPNKSFRLVHSFSLNFSFLQVRMRDKKFYIFILFRAEERPRLNFLSYESQHKVHMPVAHKNKCIRVWPPLLSLTFVFSLHITKESVGDVERKNMLNSQQQ